MKNLKNSNNKDNKIKIQGFAVSIALIVIGLLFIIFPADSMRIICYVAGAVLLVLGVYKIIVYFASGMRETSLAAGVALIAVGILLFVKPDIIAEFLTVLFGIVLIVDGVLKVQQAVTLARMKVRSCWWVLTVAVITLVLGLVIAFDPFSSSKALMVFIGISLIADGIIDIITVFYCSAKTKGLQKKNDSEVIDV